MLSVNFNLSSTLDLYLEPSPPPLLPSFTGKKNCIFQKRNQFTMIHWIFMNRLSWSCTWSWTPCPRPPPWTSTSSSPPWPLPPPLPGLEHLHSSTLAHNRWLFFWISITRSSSEFLPLCGQDDSLLSWTHTHSPFSILGHPRPLPPPLPPTLPPPPPRPLHHPLPGPLPQPLPRLEQWLRLQHSILLNFWWRHMR